MNRSFPDPEQEVPPFIAALAMFIVISLLVWGVMQLANPLPREIHAEVDVARPPAFDSTSARQDSVRHTI